MLKRIIYAIFLVFLWLGGMSVKAVLANACVMLFIVYVISPLVYHYSHSLQRHLVFLNFVNYPKKVNFYEPEKMGLPGTRNFYLETEKDIKVGIWHILPNSLINEAPKKGSPDYDEWFEKSLSDSRPVLYYLHGNTASRAISHRVELYNLLRQLDWHIVTFDYRGYADSSSVTPNETGLVHDSKVVYNHIRKFTASSPLVVWGHSLGTGVSSHAVRDLCLEGKPPKALILESPFNNIRDEVKYHPLTTLFRKMPNFDWFFLEPLSAAGIEFKSDEHIAHINVPVLILHATDDLVVPFMLGKRLYETALKVRYNLPPVEFIEFDSGCGYGHKFICRAPELPDILKKFLKKICEDGKI